MIKIKTLENLIKLSNKNINSLKTEINQLTNKVIKLQKILIELDREIKQENQIFSKLPLTLFFAIKNSHDNFLQIKIETQKLAFNAIVSLNQQIDGEREKLLIQYQELKKYEIILKQQEENQKKLLQSQESNKLQENINSKIADTN